MIIPAPLVRNNICMGVHPAGLRVAAQRQIDFLSGQAPLAGGLRTVVVIGASTGYGLATRMAAAFGCGAATVGVSVERAPTPERAGTPGWYNNRCLDRAARAAGLPAVTIETDAFSTAAKNQVVAALQGMGRPADLLVYSLASPMRQDPATGRTWLSALKTVGASYVGATVDLMTGELGTCTIGAATPDEIEGTVKVMGGEDWFLWVHQLQAAGALAPGCRTLAYSYIGPELSQAIYRQGTIGRAKEHLERTARELDGFLRAAPIRGRAWVSVNKGLVTRASAVIPGISLYMGCLFRVMKEKDLHEGCAGQIARLFRDYLAKGDRFPVDGENRIRLDDREMRADVQAEVARRVDLITERNLREWSDLAGIRHDFLEAHGFDVPGVDYGADVDVMQG